MNEEKFENEDRWEDEEEDEEEIDFDVVMRKGKVTKSHGPMVLSEDGQYDYIKVNGPLSSRGKIQAMGIKVNGPAKLRGPTRIEFNGKINGPLVAEQLVCEGHLKVNGPTKAQELNLSSGKFNGPVVLAGNLRGEKNIKINGPITAESVEAFKLKINGPVEVEQDVVGRKSVKLSLPWKHRGEEPVLDVGGVIKAPFVYIRKSPKGPSISQVIMKAIGVESRQERRVTPLLPIDADIEGETVILDGVAHSGSIKCIDLELLNGATTDSDGFSTEED